MEHRTLFQEKGGSEALTYEELESSYRAERFGARSITKPIEHYEFIARLAEMLSKENQPFGLKKIFINKNDVQLMKKKDEEVPMTVNNFRINRLVGRIILPNIQNEESQYSIAYGYSDRGFELAMGLNVKVCQNLSIFAAETLRTFGPNRLQLQELFTRFIFWIRSMERFWRIDNMVAEGMKGFGLDQHTLNLIMMDLTLRAYKSEAGDPFNQGEMKSLTLKAYDTNMPAQNAWEFYNMGTAILHPKNLANTERMISMNEKLGMYLLGMMGQLKNEVEAHKEWVKIESAKYQG